MALGNIDLGQALRRLADKRIEEAMAEGKFDNLPGMGQPLELEPMPAEEDARLAWWCIRILKQNDFVPDEVRWRKMLDHLRAELATATTAQRVRLLVERINGLVKQVNTLGTNALKSAIVPVDLETELADLKKRSG